MPLVRITARDSYGDTALAAIAGAVHAALVEAVHIPADDRFQIVQKLPASMFISDPHFLEIERREPVLVEVTLRAGRDDTMKRAFYQRAAELAREGAGVRPEDLMIVLRENTSCDWSFGNGTAQYAPEPASV
jgi:4-oxalocrotonate tautomerase